MFRPKDLFTPDDLYRPRPMIKIESETRLVCPSCHMGFISIDDEMENKFTFPNNKRDFIVPVNHPTCNNCDSKFEVSIDKTLKIKMRRIGL